MEYKTIIYGKSDDLIYMKSKDIDVEFDTFSNNEKPFIVTISDGTQISIKLENMFWRIKANHKGSNYLKIQRCQCANSFNDDSDVLFLKERPDWIIIGSKKFKMPYYE